MTRSMRRGGSRRASSSPDRSFCSAMSSRSSDRRDTLARSPMKTARKVLRILLLVTTAAIVPRMVAAQETGKPWDLDCEHRELEGQHYICRGQVTFVQGDTKLYADELEWFRDDDHAIARGNVVFS